MSTRLLMLCAGSGKFTSEVYRMRQKDGSALLRETLESMWVAMFVTTPDGRILEVNKAGCDLLGYTKEEILSMGTAGIVGPETAEQLRMTAQEQTSGEEVSIKSEGFCKCGTRIPVQLNSTVVKIGDKEMVVTMMRASSSAEER